METRYSHTVQHRKNKEYFVKDLTTFFKLQVPPISLTKGELTALYEAAVAKGETLKLDTGDNSNIHAAVHELDSSESHKLSSYHSPEDNVESSGDNDPTGYYYYYYPIKSFLDEMSSQPSSVSIS